MAGGGGGTPDFFKPSNMGAYLGGMGSSGGGGMAMQPAHRSSLMQAPRYEQDGQGQDCLHAAFGPPPPPECPISPYGTTILNLTSSLPPETDPGRCPREPPAG